VSPAVRETLPQPEIPQELLAFPDVAPYATTPVAVTCRQGAYSYDARQLALRQGRILFVDPDTGQLGIALWKSGEGVDARQYPFAGTAVIMFLRGIDPVDED
jgi:hypothetical protein